ncbi:hypothetical protein EBU94_00410 [bacterium]|nr:hypothetical protein [bacterium]
MNDQQTNRQHPIPQNFMDVEFKIVGDFTVRQFIYLCATGLPCYFIYQAPLQGFLKTIGVLFFGILGIILVFVPIDDRTADVWIVNFFRAVYGDSRRVWRKTPKVPKTLTLETIKIVQGEMITLAPTASRRKLEEYLKGITPSSEGDDLDFNFNKNKYIYTEEVVTHVTTSISPQEPISQVTFKPDTIVEKPEVVQTVTEKPAIQEVTLKLSKPFVEKPIEQEIEAPISPQPKPQTQQVVQKTTLPIPQKVAPIIQKITTQPIVQKPKEEIHEEFRVTTGEIPGRKFVSFSEKEQELILPLRGERKINLFASNGVEETQRKDIKTLAKELRSIVREIKVENKDLLEKTSQTPPSQETKESHEVSGIIFDNLNNPISNIMVALLDKDGNEIKYARTDNLGKFVLKDTDFGDFQIKVLNPEVFNLNFDIIKLSIEKYPVPIIQITGKQK